MYLHCLFSGFDEYMNLVLDNASEVHMKRKTEKKLGRIMLKVLLTAMMDKMNAILSRLLVFPM